MSEIKLISPILDNFCIGDPISDKNGVRSCPAMKENEDDRYILKVVSIPASQTKLEALLLAGAYPNAEAANAYFLEQAQALVQELETLNNLTEQDGFFPVRQWQLQPMDEGETGYDVYILTDYRRTLKRQFYKEPLTHLNAVNLGIDICAALTACRRAGYLYADLKPTNILVTQDKRFKISDLGFIKLDSLAYASLPERYRSAYTAPEIADAYSALSNTMDVYALGLVLYQAYNNGALPFTGDTAPAQVFDAPDYADYEMSEIILKACDPDPANRWQDPAEMGQALVSYMQRNGANDTPIVTVSAIVEEAPIAVEEAPEISDAEEPAEVKEVEDLTEIEENTDNIDTDELAELLDDEDLEDFNEQDDRIPVDSEEKPYEPTPVDDSEPLGMTVGDFLEMFRIPGFDDDDTNSNAEESSVEEDSTDESDDAFLSNIALDQAEDVPELSPEENSDIAQETEEDSTSEFNSNQTTMIFGAADNNEEVPTTEEPAPETVVPAVKRKNRWLGWLIAIAILIALAAGVYCGYKFYYIKQIDSITLDGKLDSLTVSVESDADPSLLTVYCVGNGTRISAELVDGKATFTNLNPDQRYLIEIDISGLHGLNGKTSATYYTPSQVSLEGLLVQVGDTDGSAKLSFATKKPYSGQWIVEYVTEGEDKQTVTADSSEITLSNLTVGKTYDISIAPVTGNNWITNNTCTFTAQPVIRAQDVTIAEYKNGLLNIVWTCPSEVSTWTVRCYNNTDYNKTVTVSDCAASFEGLDPSQNYTVEIYAENQTQFQLLHIDDATLPVEDFTASLTEENFIELSWTCAKDIPEGGWIVEYTFSESEDVYKIENILENTVLLKDAIPGASYVFSLHAANDAVVIASNANVTVAEAEAYSNNYGGTYFNAEYIRFKMCIQPEDGNWDSNALTYTTKFKAGDLAGFKTEATEYYNETVDTEILILYVIRDENGKLVSFDSQEVTWKSLFNNYKGSISVPTLPDGIGKYTLDIYYNGGFVTTQEFEIVE